MIILMTQRKLEFLQKQYVNIEELIMNRILFGIYTKEFFVLIVLLVLWLQKVTHETVALGLYFSRIKMEHTTKQSTHSENGSLYELTDLESESSLSDPK